MTVMAKEIERQFALEEEITAEDLWKEFDTNKRRYDLEYLEDQYTSYLYTSPIQVRIRKVVDSKKNTSYYLTIKGQYETEVEVPITKEQYDEIQSLIGKEPIHKKAISITIDKTECLMMYVVDPGTDTSFAFAEVEFDSIAEANKFKWPFTTISATEVTGCENINPGNTMSMPEYWERYRVNKE